MVKKDRLLKRTEKLVFSDEGLLQEEVVDENNFNFNLGAKPDQKIEFNFGESLVEGGDGSRAITQYGSFSSVSSTLTRWL